VRPPTPNDLEAAAESLGLPPGSIDAAVVARYQAHVEQVEPDRCHFWIGSQHGNGYGYFTVRGRRVSAHRFAQAVWNGPLTDDAPLALHSCDQPSCVNPRHLRAGTYVENGNDASRRRRQFPRRIFTDDEILAMRRDYDYLMAEGFLPITVQREVARRFRTSPDYALKLIRGRTARGKRLGLDKLPVPKPTIPAKISEG